MEAKLLVEMEKISTDIQETIDEKNMSFELSATDVDILDDRIMYLECLLEKKTREYSDVVLLSQQQKCCEHVFVDDLIDLTPEDSKVIVYCVNCYLER